MLTCTCHCPHQSIHSPHQSIHTSLSTPGKLNIRAAVPVQVPEWFLRLQPKPIYTRVLCTSTIIVVRISRVYSVDWTIGLYILRQQIETNPLPNIDTCGATLTPFHAPLHHVNLISFYSNEDKLHRCTSRFFLQLQCHRGKCLQLGNIVLYIHRIKANRDGFYNPAQNLISP